MLEAAKKAGQSGELLSQRDLQQVYQATLNPPKAAPAKVRGSVVDAGRSELGAAAAACQPGRTATA